MIWVRSISALVATLFAAGTAAAQFSSGSDGSDGALSFPPSATPVTVIFDPASYNPPKDPDGDGVYHFTTINIPQNVTVRVQADKVGWQPIYWLATGNVTIAGTLDLNGEDNKAPAQGWTIPGPGGFPGGPPPGNPGFGPGNNANGGQHPGNPFLSPLTGGSGGRGGSGTWGGAGGGALLLASNTSIQVNGIIRARGGNGSSGTGSPAGGAGGALHLLSPNFSGTGSLQLQDGLSGGGDGWLRVEATTNTYTGTYGGNADRRRIVTLIPEPLVLFRPMSDFYQARMVRIGGIELPNPTTNSFTVPDVVIDTDEPVTFEIEAENIPLGTTFQIVLFNETTYHKHHQTSGLQGTLASSTATADIVVEHGYSTGYFFTWFTDFWE